MVDFRKYHGLGNDYLVIDPAGRLAFDTAQAMQDRVGRLRHGIRHVRGSRQAAGGAGGGE